jgi:predicted enzyme related to lactoylglutathione lyase
MKSVEHISTILIMCVALACMTSDVVRAQADVAGKPLTMSTNPDLPSTVSVIVLGVSSLPNSVAFYRDTLGLKVSVASDGLAFVSLSGLTLMLSTDLGKAFQPVAGATELVFPVGSVASSYGLLNQRGCKFLNQPREVTPGSWAATFQDPDGHKLSVFGPR